MNDAAKDLLKCPLCEGRGEIHKQALLDRLREKDFGKKVESYLSNIVDAEQSEELGGLPTEHGNKDVTAWNLTHFLWRRSPKE
jgi:hypothetical protein